MNTKGTNRSVRRTKKKLREVLAKLMFDKPVSAITVREISELADINRGTFYLHYRSVYDMITQIENELFESFNAALNSVPVQPADNGPRELLGEIFLLLEKNSDMVVVLLGKNGDMAFVNRLKLLVKEKCFVIWGKNFEVLDPALYETYFAFMVSGCIGVIERWLADKCNKSASEMADIVGMIIVNGFSALTEC